MAQEIKMSASGLKAMQDELEYLKTVRRKELAEEIKEARSHGDLSENSEYDEAKNTQGLVENRITELEQMVKNAVIIDESELSVDSVAVGTHVSIKMIGDDEAEEYDIVGRTEADPINGKISDESPVGHALLGKAVGEKAEVLLPSGQTVEYEVLAITPVSYTHLDVYKRQERHGRSSCCPCTPGTGRSQRPSFRTHRPEPPGGSRGALP